jgi:hypothetical protein
MIRIGILIIILIYGLFLILPAQQITGSLEGRVLDPQGLTLQAVNVVISGPGLQGTWGVSSDEKGYFRILALPPGKYDLHISHIAHHDVNINDVLVELGKTTSIGSIKMTARTFEAPEVIVYGEQPVIDPVSTQYGGNLHPEYFQQMPLGRSYKDMITLLPQVNVSYYGDAANFGGSTGHENKYFIDGVEVTDPLFGSKAMDLPYNFIQEVEVKAGGYGVDSRSSLGGLINVITHSGSNKFHGSVFGFFTSNQLSNNDRLSSVGQGDFSNYDVGFSLGGPVILDRLWFYAAYNPTFYRRDVEVSGFGTLVDQTLSHKFALKLNWKPTNNFKVILTANGDPTHRDAVNSDPTIILANIDPYLKDITEGSVNYSLNSSYTVGKSILLQGLVARVDRYARTIGATERGRNEIYYWDVQNSTLSGGVGGNWDAFRRMTFGRISATILLNQHTLSSGIEYKNNSINLKTDKYRLSRWPVAETTDVYYYQEDIEIGYGQVQSRIPSLFVQDSWRIMDKLSVTAGVRWEGHSVVDANEEVIQTISVPLQPHMGIVFLPVENNRHRIFASFRRFSHEYAQPATNFNLGYEKTVYYDNDPRVDNTGEDIIKNIQHPIKPEEKELRGQYSDEFSLGYEIIIGWNIKTAVQGVYRTLGEAIEDIYILGENRTLVGNPGRGTLSAWPEAHRDYKALILTVERTGEEHFNFLASYVLSKNYGNYEGLFDAFTYRGPNSNVVFNDRTTSWENTTGLLPNDRTHVFKFSGYYNFPFGLTTGISFIAQSGTPLSEYAGGYWAAIKFLQPRGSVGRAPAIWDLNARLTYNLDFISSWHSRLILDILHIASQQKAVEIFQRRFWDPNEWFPTNRYGQVTRYQPSMSVRLGMEVSF